MTAKLLKKNGKNIFIYQYFQKILEEDLSTLFKFVCTNNEEIKDKFITLLTFFELCDKHDEYIDISKFLYACSLFEMTLKTIN